MKLKHVLWIMTAIAAVAALAAGVALFVNRYILCDYDRDYIECDCEDDDMIEE